MSLQDGQQGYFLHPPDPDAPRRAFPRARPQRMKRRGVCFVYVEPLNDVRTKPDALFAILHR